MPKYMVTGSYTVDGLKGVLAEGGTSRVAVVKQLVEAAGGTLEAMYFAFGGDDFVIISDLPDQAAGLAINMMTVSTGSVTLKTTVLLTPEEVDAATKKAISYRPPGQ